MKAEGQKLKEGTFTGNTLSGVHLDRYILTETYHEQNQKVAKHSHEHCYMSLLLDGFYEEESIVADEAIHAGTTLIRTADYEHQNQIGSVNGRCFNLEIKNEIFQKSVDKLSKKYFRLEKYNLEMMKVYFAFRNKHDDQFMNLQIDESLYSLLANEYGGRSTKNPTWIKQVQSQIKDEPGAYYSIDSLASSYNIHPVYFVRKFKTKTGLNFSEFLSRQRLSKAISLMHETNASLTEIAAKSGFYDQSHFIRRFKEQFHETPSQFIKLMKG